MLKFGETKIAPETFYVPKRPIKICDVNFDNTVISKLVKAKINPKYLIGYLDKTIKPLVLLMPKMSWYIKTFKVKGGDKYPNNKLMSFLIDDEKLLEKYKAIWTKIEGSKTIKLNALPVYYGRYMKTKTRTYSDKVYTNFRGLNVLEDDIECESLTAISIDSLVVYNKKYYRQVYLDSCAFKILNKQMTDYLDENFFED